MQWYKLGTIFLQRPPTRVPTVNILFNMMPREFYVTNIYVLFPL